MLKVHCEFRYEIILFLIHLIHENFIVMLLPKGDWIWWYLTLTFDLESYIINLSDCVKFYVSPTVTLRCRRHTVFGCVRPWVSPWMSLWVRTSRKHCKRHISKTNEKRISPTFGHGCIWVHKSADYHQKVKGLGHSRRRHNRWRKSIEFHLIYTWFI